MSTQLVPGASTGVWVTEANQSQLPEIERVYPSLEYACFFAAVLFFRNGKTVPFSPGMDYSAFMFFKRTDGTAALGTSLNGTPEIKCAKLVDSSSTSGGRFDRDMPQLLLPVLFTFALMHCTNVASVDVPLARRYRRQQARVGNVVDAIRVKTLHLVAFSANGPDEASTRSAEAGYTPLHLVRGHFATYTEDRKLFGKYTGRFWIPQHNRGSAAFGEVKKRYTVAATDEHSLAGAR